MVQVSSEFFHELLSSFVVVTSPGRHHNLLFVDRYFREWAHKDIVLVTFHGKRYLSEI